MKFPYHIFVEGTADKTFVIQLVESLFGDGTCSDEHVTATNGRSSLMSPSTQQTYINIMNRTKADGGINLVIFDADDNPDIYRNEIEAWKKKHSVDFELFLLPDNSSCGALEDLLEKIINPENQPIMDCWKNYETNLKKVKLPWKKEQLTLPAKKTKIYAYLEVLLGPSKSEKEKIKEKSRNYKNSNHWDLESIQLHPLTEFLKRNLQ